MTGANLQQFASVFSHWGPPIDEDLVAGSPVAKTASIKPSLSSFPLSLPTSLLSVSLLLIPFLCHPPHAAQPQTAQLN